MRISKPSISRVEWKAKIKEILIEAEKKKQYKITCRELAKRSLFFLCIYILDWDYLDNDFAYGFCAEIDKKCFGRIFICAREHYKSTLVTVAHTIQLIIRNPEERIGIYSYNADTAGAFYNQIKSKIESCDKLKYYFSDIFYTNPKKEARDWTTESLTVKRKGDYKESTLERSGLITGQRTGRHYTIGVYDDCVTEDSVKTTEMIESVKKTWAMSLSTLDRDSRFVVVGTFYHFDDLYCHIIKNKILEPIIQPAFDENEEPVLYTKAQLEAKKKAQGSNVFATQYLCDPKAARKDVFKREWLKTWSANNFFNLNIYIFVDPAGDKGRKRDYTAIWVVGLAGDGNYMVIDLIRDKLNLVARKNILFELHRRYNPIAVFYEKVGMQADKEFIELEMERLNYRFQINTVSPQTDKNMRIQSLAVLFEQGKLYFPSSIYHKNWEGYNENMLESFLLEEYDKFPFASHDDALDSLSMLVNPQVSKNLCFPEVEKRENTRKELQDELREKQLDYDPLWDM